MSNTNDFIIENGILTGYKGTGGMVVVPEGVVEIRSDPFKNSRYSFCYREDITGIVLPNSLKRLGSYAFYKCNDLSSVSFPEELEMIDGHAFEDTKWLVEQPKGYVCGANVLIRYNGEETDVVLPEKVTVLGYGAFCGCNHIRNISLHERIPEIPDAAFSGCAELSEIIIPNSVKRVGNMSFCDCKSLKHIKLPDSIETIEKDAFYRCNHNLLIEYAGKKYSMIPKERRAYLTIAWLKETDVFPEEQQKNIQKDVFRLRQDLFLLLKWGGNDESACKKCSNANEKKQLQKFKPSVAFPWDDPKLITRLLSVGDWNAEEISRCIATINDGTHPQMTVILLDYKNNHCNVTEQDNSELSLSENNSLILSIAEAKRKWKFIKDPKMGGYKITGYLGADSHPIMPTQIAGTDVVAIGNGAFRGCETIITMELPDTLRNIGNSIFAECEMLEEIRFPGNIEVLPKSIFLGCKRLKRVILPSNLKELASWAIPPHVSASGIIKEANYQLEEITIDSENEVYGTSDGVLYEKKSGKLLHFPAMKNSFIIPESIKKIPTGAFSFSQLSRMTFHSKITSIGMLAFYNCENLVSVTIPEGKMKEILDSAFMSCSNLNDIHLPASIKKISTSSFSGCNNLTVYAPAGSYAEQYAKEHNIPFVAE